MIWSADFSSSPCHAAGLPAALASAAASTKGTACHCGKLRHQSRAGALVEVMGLPGMVLLGLLMPWQEPGRKWIPQWGNPATNGRSFDCGAMGTACSPPKVGGRNDKECGLPLLEVLPPEPGLWLQWQIFSLWFCWGHTHPRSRVALAATSGSPVPVARAGALNTQTGLLPMGLLMKKLGHGLWAARKQRMQPSNWICFVPLINVLDS